jgi:hypothetical protein
VSWELLVEAYQRRAWAALGYSTWDAYTDAELGQVRLRLPREDRREVVASMTEAGMSTRAIGSALGVSREQVRRDTKVSPEPEPIDAEIVGEEPDPLGDRIARELAASDDTYAEQATSTVGPEPASAVLGTDGKTYTTTSKPAAQRRRPLPESFWQAAYDLTKVTERIERLAADDRFPQNADQVATAHRNDLIRAIDALQGVGRLLETHRRAGEDQPGGEAPRRSAPSARGYRIRRDRRHVRRLRRAR